MALRAGPAGRSRRAEEDEQLLVRIRELHAAKNYDAYGYRLLSRRAGPALPGAAPDARPRHRRRQAPRASVRTARSDADSQRRPDLALTPYRQLALSRYPATATSRPGVWSAHARPVPPEHHGSRDGDAQALITDSANGRGPRLHDAPTWKRYGIQAASQMSFGASMPDLGWRRTGAPASAFGDGSRRRNARAVVMVERPLRVLTPRTLRTGLPTERFLERTAPGPMSPRQGKDRRVSVRRALPVEDLRGQQEVCGLRNPLGEEPARRLGEHGR
jgi:hypothetical protein